MLDTIGNSKGWWTSAALAAAMLLAVLYLQVTSRILPPTAWGRQLKDQLLNLPAVDSRLLPEQVEGDGGNLYWQAAGEYRGSLVACQAFADDPGKPVPAPVRNLLAAARCKDAAVFAKHLDQLLNYDATHDQLDNLKSLGDNVAGAALLLIKTGRTDKGRQYAKALISLGQAMIRERYTWDEFTDGVTLMSNGLVLLKTANVPGESDLAGQSHDALKAYYKDSREVWRILGGQGLDNYLTHGGDFLYLAAHTRDPLWRDEAILQMGRTRWALGENAPTSRAATFYAQKLSNEGDRVIATAGMAARELTDAVYQGFHPPEPTH